MKASEAMVLWTPIRMDLPTKGRVLVCHSSYKKQTREERLATFGRREGRFEDELRLDNDFNRVGAWNEIEVEGPVMRMAVLLSRFHTIVVRDGIDPMDAHREFLKIDEYRGCIAPDCEGADQ